MALAKGLKRTLVLPPWVEYTPGQRKPNMVPWDSYFQVIRFNLKALRMSSNHLALGSKTFERGQTMHIP